FFGGDTGLSLAQTLARADLNPTALELAALRNTELDLYAAAEGRESVTLVTFALHGGAPSPHAPERPLVPLLLPPGEESLAIVATLVPGRLRLGDIGAEDEGKQETAFLVPVIGQAGTADDEDSQEVAIDPRDGPRDIAGEFVRQDAERARNSSDA